MQITVTNAPRTSKRFTKVLTMSMSEDEAAQVELGSLTEEAWDSIRMARTAALKENRRTGHRVTREVKL